MNLVSNRTLQDQTSVIAQYLRGDPLHAAKNVEGSNLYKVINGLAYEFLRERDLVNNVYSEYDPTTTTNFIEEWEGFVGIPDDCLTNTGTIEQRRRNVLLKLVGINATTKEQFESIATALGFSIIVSSGADAGNIFPYVFPFIFQNAGEEPFTIFVTLLTPIH